MDFGALPPEINSGRMYAGPGSGPMLAAAAAWEALAAELGSSASAYGAVLAGLTSQAWSGPSSASMTAAATPYVTWMSSTAGHAEQAAAGAKAVATAYEAAFAATVPPPVIAANRSLLASLIATNLLGQNTPAIAATEAHYGEMWAQDAVAMYGYAAGAATAATLAPFNAPPRTTNLDAMGRQAAATAQATGASAGSTTQQALAQMISAVPQALQGLASSAPAAADPTSPLLAALDALAGPLSPVSLFGIGGIPYLLAMQCVLLPMNGSNVVAALAKADAAGVLAPQPTELGTRLASAPLSAGLGNADAVGRLSVPRGWTAATPAARAVAAAFPEAGPGAVSMVAAEGESSLMSDLALGSLAGRAIGGTGGAASRAVGGAGKPGVAHQPSTATIIVIPPSAED